MTFTRYLDKVFVLTHSVWGITLGLHLITINMYH